jgi:hypothetical protein
VTTPVMTAAFDEPLLELDELPADELPLRDDADDEPLREALDFGRLREDALLEEPLLDDALLDEPLLDDALLDEPLLDDALLEEPLLDDALRDEPLLDEALRLPFPELLRLFGLEPFELLLEPLLFVPDRELVWAIFPPWSNAPRSCSLYPFYLRQNALGSRLQAVK